MESRKASRCICCLATIDGDKPQLVATVWTIATNLAPKEYIEIK
jgi:hypothetical protein